MATTANLDRTAFRSPLAVGQEGVGQTENLRGRLYHPSEPSFPQADEGHLSVCHGHTPDEPIWIPSDAESDVDDSDDSNDRLDTDDSQSDDTLPSVDTLVTTSKILSTIAETDGLSNIYENTEDDCRQTIEQHRSDSAADTLASAVQCMPPAANTPQGDKASQDDAAGSTSHADFIPTAGSAVDPNPVPTISEASRSRQSSPSSPEGRGVGMSTEASHAQLMPPTAATQEDTASQDDAGGTLANADFIPTGGAAADPDTVLTTPEAYPSRRSSPSTSGRGVGMEYGGSRSAEARLSRLTTEMGQKRLHNRSVSIESSAADSSGDNSNSSSDGDSAESESDSHTDSDSPPGSDGCMHGDQEYCPSPGGGVEREPVDGQGHNTDSSELPPRKRRKVKPSLADTRSRHGGGILSRHANAANLPPYSMPSPPSSHRLSDDGDGGSMAAKFEEWPLQNATLKRVFVNGEAIFQLQFGWDPRKHNHLAGNAGHNSPRPSAARRKAGGAKRNPGTSVTFTQEEDELLANLKEGPDKLTWPEIHRRFSHAFPERRSQGSLQVRYSTKLKGRGVRSGL